MLPLERIIVLATHVDQVLHDGEVFDISVDLICARKTGGVDALGWPFMQTKQARLTGKCANRLIILFYVDGEGARDGLREGD